MTAPSSIWPLTERPLVEAGWLTVYNTSYPESRFIKSSARDQLLARIKELLTKYKDEKVSVVVIGHSLGASLAALSAFDLAVNAVPSHINVTAFPFACPRVGNDALKKKYDEQSNLRVLRVTNALDLVPLVPLRLLPLFDYADVGENLPIDNRNSPYLKERSSYLTLLTYQLTFHDVAGMVHTLSGWNGEKGTYDLNILNRSLALANMANDLLKEEFKIPPSWWVEKNKGIVLTEKGEWLFPAVDPADHDLPTLVQE